MLVHVAVLLGLALAQDPIAPTARTRRPYWQMVDEIIAQIESRPPRAVSIGQGLQTAGQEYPFETFRHLRAADLVRAAKEGVEEARLQESLGVPKAEVDQLVLRNVALALDYLPLIVREDSDVFDLIVVMVDRNADPVFRRYLLDHSTPGYAPDSLLARTLPGFMEGNGKAFTERLGVVVSHPAERPDMQSRAIELSFSRLLKPYVKVFHEDPAVQLLIDAGQQVDYTLAAHPEAFELSPDTRKEMERWGRRMNLFAEVIAGHIAEGSVRDEQVKSITRQTLEHMHDAIIGVNKEHIALYLVGKTPEKTMEMPDLSALFGDEMPVMPTAGPEGAAPFPIPGEATPLRSGSPKF